MKDWMWACIIAFLIFGVILYITDKPDVAHFFEIPGTDIRWQLDRKPPRGPEPKLVDHDEFNRMVSAAEPNSTIMVYPDGSLKYIKPK